jgi:hypothetical protein
MWQNVTFNMMQYNKREYLDGVTICGKAINDLFVSKLRTLRGMESTCLAMSATRGI